MGANTKRADAKRTVGILICAVICLISAAEWGKTRMQAAREADTVAQLAELTRKTQDFPGDKDRITKKMDQAENEENAANEEIRGQKLAAQKADHESRDYARLAEKNSDFEGWIWIPGTAVDLPVMNDPQDPQKYLRKDFWGKTSLGGSLFLAEGCTMDSDCLLIYGHNMRNGAMFGSLGRYRKREYWQQHRWIEIYMPKEQREYEVFAVFQTTVPELASATETDAADLKNGFPYYRYAGNFDQGEFQAFVGEICRRACYDTGIVPEFGEQILLLSTCSYHAKDGRLVVAAKSAAVCATSEQ
ncbi:class B sortase [Brotaphodocola sp.]|uniref:class B sortase n=1 Tax=Brotaphodocola sp. TaxID=3073577 RepID=UPI003D7F1644